MIINKNILFTTLALLFTTSCSHQQQKQQQQQHHHHKKGGMNKKFISPNLDPDKWKNSFEDNKRDVYHHRQDIINSLDIKMGDIVADIGAGTGAFLKGLNSKVGPSGKVYAVEISEKFVKYMSRRVKDEKLTSTEVIKGEFHTTTLPTSSTDHAILIDVYHHLDEPTDMLNDFKRILKPNGTLAIVDFDKIPGVSRQWIINHLRLQKSEYIQEVSKAGFKFIEEKEIPFKENFMLIFKKQ